MQAATSLSIPTMESLVRGTLTGMLAQPTKEKPTSTASKIAKSSDLFRRRSRFQCPTTTHKCLFDAVAQFAGEVNFTKPRWLTLIGTSGVGKTMLAKEAYRHFMEYSRFEVHFDAQRYRIDGNTGQYCQWRRFAKAIQSGEGQGWEHDLGRDWFVVFDDIGSEDDPWGKAKGSLDRLADARIGKWTLWTSNLPLGKFAEKLDTRIADRMLRNGSVVVETNLESWALTNPKH